MAPVFQCIFVENENRKYLYPWDDSIFRAYTHKTSTLLQSPSVQLLLCFTLTYVSQDSIRNKSIFLLKLPIQSVLTNLSLYNLAIKADYYLVNLRILSGCLPLGVVPWCVPVAFLQGESRLRRGVLLTLLCFRQVSASGTWTPQVPVRPWILASHLPALHLSFLPFYKYTWVTFWKTLAFTLNMDSCWL